MKFLVWDQLNSEEEFAKEIEARNSEEAAKEYAAADHDGNTDGIYDSSDGQPICVRTDDGVKVYWVYVEYEPTYYAHD